MISKLIQIPKRYFLQKNSGASSTIFYLLMHEVTVCLTRTFVGQFVFFIEVNFAKKSQFFLNEKVTDMLLVA